MVHPEYRPQKPNKSFTGKLYGFKIHPSAYDMQGPGTKAVRMAQGHTIPRNNARAMNWDFLCQGIFIFQNKNSITVRGPINKHFVEISKTLPINPKKFDHN